MKYIFNKIFQALIDIVIGASVYFTLSAFLPEANSNVIIMVALVATAIFAETVEIRFKK